MTLQPAISHERCSELLVPLVRGDLAPAETASVEGHLEGCTGCAGELAAVRSLLGAPVEAMDDLERARLRAGIAGELRQVVPVADPYVHPDPDDAPRNLRRGSRRRMQPGAWLGVAAATLILFAGGLAYLGSGGLVVGGSDQGGAAGTAGSAEERALGDGDAGARAPRAMDEAPDSRPLRGPAPLVVRGRTDLTEETLTRLGRTDPTFRAFARVYGFDDIGRLQGRFTRALERGLDNALLGPCLNQAIGAQPESLPAYGALGTLDGRRVLVLGFFIAGSQDPAVHRFSVRWWGLRGPGEPARCPRPLGSSGGPIGAGESR